MNDTVKPTIDKVSTTSKPVNQTRKGGGKPPNGKATERETMQLVQNYYGMKCRIDRLPDTLDTGKYEDRRPCDLFVTLRRGLEGDQNTIWYVECKETGQDRKNLQFSVLNSGQKKAIAFTIANRIPYFVVFQHLKSKTLYLIPALIIHEFEQKGKKSMNENDLEPYIWLKRGKLYDFYSS